jgi:hypothetical protein
MANSLLAGENGDIFVSHGQADELLDFLSRNSEL